MSTNDLKSTFSACFQQSKPDGPWSHIRTLSPEAWMTMFCQAGSRFFTDLQGISSQSFTQSNSNTWCHGLLTGQLFNNPFTALHLAHVRFVLNSVWSPPCLFHNPCNDDSALALVGDRHRQTLDSVLHRKLCLA